ncbi:MAG: helix-turn-helix transcriptional regulator [Campylobacterales bacterium]|nr:helix-turn-helix transcriptional regulator [Campylobacterales bacterium]
MEVWEKINYLLEEKKMTKQEFANHLIALAPKLKRTGEVPSTQTILGYLYGKREIKIELIPFIAEVLGINEQELFSSHIEYASENNIRYSKEVREIVNLLQYLPQPAFIKLKSRLLEYKKMTEKGFE